MWQMGLNSAFRGLKEGFIYPFTFSCVSNAGILMIFYLVVLKLTFVNVVILVVAILRQTGTRTMRRTYRASLFRN